MPAVAGAHRPPPGAGGEGEEVGGEAGAELLGDLLRGAAAVEVLEHEAVGERGEIGRVDRFVRDLGEGGFGRGAGAVVAAGVGREVEVAEARARGQREAVGVGRVPGRELAVGRRLEPCQVGEEEVHLLRQPPLDDLVALVEAERRRLAGEDALHRLLLAERAEPGLVGQRPALGELHERELPHVVGRQLDARRVGLRGGRGRELRIGGEEQAAEDEEVQQRVPGEAHERPAPGRSGRISHRRAPPWPRHRGFARCSSGSRTPPPDR